LPYLREAGLIDGDEPLEDEFAHLVQIVEAVRGNLTVLAEIPAYAKIFLSEFEIEPEAREWLSRPGLLEVLNELRDTLVARGELDFDAGKEVVLSLRERFKERGITGKNLFMPVRVALTGSAKGPELPYILDILSKEEALGRIDTVVEEAEKAR
ncbi:MAG: glutamate--tRNA ligase, partial [Actinobacteria bacterium]|nr:glutamate--tRNA ligase [Actinomycetota bacterium]